MMVGRAVLFDIKKEKVNIGNTLVKVNDIVAMNDLGTQKVKNVSFEIREGEVLGIAGVEGNGQTELVEVLAGLRKANSGSYMIDGVELLNNTPRQIRLSGLSHVPEDRHKRATIDEFTVNENLILGDLDKYVSKGIINYNLVEKTTKEMIEKYDIRPTDGKVIYGGLSGGNQQKVVVARELEKENKFIIVSQPTRGVDIGAIEMIHNTILHERTKGKAILVVSAELTEIMTLSDRIAVMYSGKIVGVLDRKDATMEKLGILMAGGKLDE